MFETKGDQIACDSRSGNWEYGRDSTFGISRRSAYGTAPVLVILTGIVTGFRVHRKRPGLYFSRT